MKGLVFVVAGLATFAASGVAQSVCRQAKANIVERHEAFTIVSVLLPSLSRSVAAKALIPNTDQPAGAFVFSLSTLVGSEPERFVDMMPVATDLARQGRAAILIQRKLTWPTIDPSVGRMQAQVLCAEQWLSAHAAVKSDGWTFVGPESDVPTLDQLHAIGDTTSKTFRWGFPLGESSESRNTESVLRDGSLWLAAEFVKSFH
jgi:hypothetical protein